MNNQETTQKPENFTSEEFFSQLKNLLLKAPEETVYCILALENPEGPKDKKEGVLSLNGSNHDLMFLFSEAFRRSNEIKETVFTSVEFFKYMDYRSSSSSILDRIFRNKAF